MDGPRWRLSPRALAWRRTPAARFSSAWKAHIDRIFCDARRAGRREPRAAYAADALVALAREGPCKPVEVRVTVDSAALARGHTNRASGVRSRVRPGSGHDGSGAARRRAVTVMARDGDDITAVSSPKRTIPAKLRRALEARYPNCGVRVVRKRPVPRDRPHRPDRGTRRRTEIDNLWRICSHHHDAQDPSRLEGRREPGDGTSSRPTIRIHPDEGGA